jgi:chromosome segregation protein
VAEESESVRLQAESARLAGDISQLSEHLGAVRKTADELEALLSGLRQDSADAYQHRGRIEVELTKIQSDAEHLARSCLTELGQPLKEVISSVDVSAIAGSQSDSPEESVGSTAGEGEIEVAGFGRSSPQALDEIEGSGDQAQTVGDATQAFGEREWRKLAAYGITALEAARERLSELRTKLDEMGSVNMMALEELEESEERFRFLSSQRDDILKSIKGTEDALAEIKRRSREKFRDAFLRVNENFQKMFVELFGGGRGEMVLIDEEDVLESGIDLIAQPPGKRLQNVLLLSGGEKAMAAIALVLSIFQYRPSPFCILDEVDAPLDEVNVGRFSDKVVEMSRETQFLMITHNKRSMESASALYGVTMEEPGVSKLVSVRFE